MEHTTITPPAVPRRRTRSFGNIPSPHPAAATNSPETQAAGLASVSHLPFAALQLAIVYRRAAELKAHNRQLRRRGRGQVEQLALNQRRFGCVVPILIRADGTIVHGHAIWLAAKENGLEEVPTVVIDHLSEAEESALRISLNRLQELSSWDHAALKTEFEILTNDIELLSYTGFEIPQVDIILDMIPDKGEPDAADHVPALGTGPAVSRPGDIWVFKGGHRLGCGDALDSASFVSLMAGEKARLAACDLPYNVPIRGHVSGQATAREFAMASGEMSRPEFVVFLRTIFAHLDASSIDGSLHLHFMDWRHMGEMLEAGHAVYDELKNLCVWTKDNAGLGSLWRSQHELCFVWKKGRAAHLNNVELGRHGRNRSNVWTYAGGNGFHRGRDQELTAHPTPKSVAMIADAILDVSQLGDIVLDPTCGSGSTLVAAHRTKRRGFGIEIDPLYVDGAVRRLEAFTKAPARHAETGLTFAETAAARATDNQPMAAE